MKKIILLLLTLSFTTAYAEGEHGHHSQKTGHDMNKGHKMGYRMSDKKIVKHILSLNESLHKAFYNYNGEEVSIISKKIVRSINKLHDQVTKKMLMMSKLKKLTSSTSRREADQIYTAFSTHLTHLIKMFKLGNIYKEYYCPMAKKSWIQNITKLKSVQNPYMPNMKTCGEIKS